jgi:hypothetical protein
MRIHPKNPNIVFAGVLGDLHKPTHKRGVYKSIDGGENWKKVLFSNENAGVVDLIMNPNNPKTLYATTWNVRRTPYSLSSGGDGSALWKNTNEEETWTNTPKNNGLPEGICGISGVTVSPLNFDIVSALIEETLYQTKSKSGQDPLNFPIRLTHKLAHLNSLTRIGNYAPTQQAINFKNKITKEIDTELVKLNALFTNGVKELNRKVKASDIVLIQLD